MVYQYKVLSMIQNLQDKKVDVIIDHNTYIPSLGNNYTKAEFIAWLEIRKNILRSARDDSEIVFQANFDNWYSNLGVQAQGVADLILSGDTEATHNLTEQQWETIVPSLIYYYITTP